MTEAETPTDLGMVVSYYSPYVSGLTEAARRVAEALVARGWKVKVAATRHDPLLIRREVLAGVEVIRAPVFGHLGKGVIAPSFPLTAARVIRRARVANLHLPMLEAGFIARLAGSTPIVTTYQCDVSLPPGPLNSLATRLVDAAARSTFSRSHAVCTSSLDYARASRLAGAAGPTRTAIPPPCLDRSGGSPTFRETDDLHVGFLGRLVEEKGIEYLVEAFRSLPRPNARLLIAGNYENVAGGSVVDNVRRAVGGDPRIRLLGFLPEDKLADFYASMDVFALPSINSLEAFGIVQIEAMLAGVPVVVTDLAGLRMPVRNTGFGCIVPPRDSAALAQALEQVASTSYGAERLEVHSLYGLQGTIDAYEQVLRRASESPRTKGASVTGSQTADPDP